MQFQEKKVLVTGAGHGIGLAVAQAFIGEGARVAINDIIPDRIAAVVEKLGSHCCGVAGDISDTEEARSVVSRAAGELGGMDIVVSNAGVYPSHAFLEMDINDWDRVMAVNVRGTFLICQAVAQLMVKQKHEGVIVTISSGSARFARVGSAHYCASKAAVVMLTRVMALELAAQHVRVNAVCPGLIMTDLQETRIDLEAQVFGTTYQEAKERLSKTVPMERLGRPAEVADLAVYLASAESSYITGQAVNIGGGILMEV